MQKHSDEALVAYLDGELDGNERAHVEAWIDADPSVRDRLLALAESASLVRNAFADIVNAAGYSSPVRQPRGRDILAACGQLKSESLRPARRRVEVRAS